MVQTLPLFPLSAFVMHTCVLSCANFSLQASMDLNSASSVVLQVLTQATSQDTAVLKPAEEQLKQWETQPGFYSVLLVSSSAKSLLSEVRHHYFNSSLSMEIYWQFSQADPKIWLPLLLSS